MQADELIRELIATGTMNEETLADLERMRTEHAEGRLDPDDEAYLRALHARVMNTPMPEPEPERGTLLEGLTIEQWRDRALKAEARLAEIAAAPDASGGN